ncbi:MAG: hypothetical protein V1888_02415 [archaeon]
MSRRSREILDNGLSKIDAFYVATNVNILKVLHKEVIVAVVNRNVSGDIERGNYRSKIVDLSVYEANVFGRYRN